MALAALIFFPLATILGALGVLAVHPRGGLKTGLKRTLQQLKYSLRNAAPFIAGFALGSIVGALPWLGWWP